MDIKHEANNPYTKAPPALPSLVTLPLPNELFMSAIAASNIFCWDGVQGFSSQYEYTLSIYYDVRAHSLNKEQSCCIEVSGYIYLNSKRRIQVPNMRLF